MRGQIILQWARCVSTLQPGLCLNAAAGATIVGSLWSADEPTNGRLKERARAKKLFCFALKRHKLLGHVLATCLGAANLPEHLASHLLNALTYLFLHLTSMKCRGSA